MCGSLKHENQRKYIGNPVLIQYVQNGQLAEVVWNGFLKSERFQWWQTQAGLRSAFVLAESFVEGKYEFPVPSGRIIGYVLERDVFISGKKVGVAGGVKILTRQPGNKFEESVHPRFPWVWEPNNTAKIYEVTDVRRNRYGQMRLL